MSRPEARVAAPQALSQLIDAGLIEPSGEGAEPSFTFRHALIHDAAYASLLRSERRSLHRRVGLALEDDLKQAADPLDLAPRLGEHFHQAGEPARARRYFTLAAEGAARVYARQEAISLYRRALDSGDVADDPTQATGLHLGLGQSLELAGRHDEALSAYEQLGALGERVGSPQIELAALMARAKIHATLTTRHDPQIARRLLEQARTQAQQQGQPAAEARVLWNLMVLHTWGGEDFATAIEMGRQSADLAKQAGAEETLAFALNDLTYPLVATLHYEAARRACAEAQSLWRRLENIPMLVDSLCSEVLLDYHFGDFDAGEQAADEALRLSEQIDNLWGQTNARLYLCQIQRERGRIAAALETMEAAIALGDRSRHPGALIASRVDLGLLLADLGDSRRGRRLIDQAETIAADLQSWLRAYPPAGRALLEAGQERWQAARRAASEARTWLRPVGLQWSAPMYLALAQAQIELADGAPEDADRTLQDLIRRVETTPELPFLPEAFRLASRAKIGLNLLPEAVHLAQASCESARRLGARWRLWPSLIALSDALRAVGDPAGAETARAEAVTVLHELLAEIPASLQGGFRNLPSVSAVLGG